MANNKQLQEISDKLSDIRTILKGEPSADKPDGLIYHVEQNTRFREFYQKALWIIFTANAGLFIWALTVLTKLTE